MVEGTQGVLTAHGLGGAIRASPWALTTHAMPLREGKKRENQNVGSNAQTLNKVFRELSSSMTRNRTGATVVRALNPSHYPTRAWSSLVSFCYFPLVLFAPVLLPLIGLASLECRTGISYQLSLLLPGPCSAPHQSWWRLLPGPSPHHRLLRPSPSSPVLYCTPLWGTSVFTEHSYPLISWNSCCDTNLMCIVINYSSLCSS